MNVCYVTHVFVRHSGDPIGSFILRLAKGIAQRGVTVTVVAPHAGGLEDHGSVDGIPVVRFRYGPDNLETLAYQGNMRALVGGSLLNKAILVSFLASCVVQTVSTIRRQKCDLIHAHWWFPCGLAACIASTITGVPLIITCHGSDVGLLGHNRIVDGVARGIFGRASGVTAVSSYLQHRLAEFLHTQDSAIPVTPMPVDHTFAEATDRTTSPAKKQYMVLGVGRLSQQKSFHDLITATALIRQRGVDANTLIIGDGVEEGALRELAGRLGLHDQVQLLGSRTTHELAEFYRTCDAVALPSHDEGLGLTLVEAMLCGAPAIGAQSGGITDLIVNNETGLLFPPGDVPALADALQRILTDGQLAGRLSTAGQSYARRHYDPALCIDKMLDVYDTVQAYKRPAA